MPGDLMQTECGGEDKARCERSCWARGSRAVRALGVSYCGEAARHRTSTVSCLQIGTPRIVRGPALWDSCLRRTSCRIFLSVPSIRRTRALKGLSHSWCPPQYRVLWRLFLGTIGGLPQKNGMDNNPNCETYLTATKTFHLALTFWQCELVQQSLMQYHSKRFMNKKGKKDPSPLP